MTQNSARSAFQVTGWSHRIGGWVERHRDLILRLAEAETQAVEDLIADNPVRAPVYVCGLARAGTTIMLEALAAHPDVGTHRYSDYPLIHLPYWWNKLSRHVLNADAPLKERAHGDGIMVSPHSPEAMEEAVWMSFFDDLHGEGRSHVLDGQTSNPGFECHYTAHVAKLLLARGKQRYVCKANYNVSRMAYLRKIFSDARFIVPVREPGAHIASLVRQHRHFTDGLADNPRALEHLRRIGHFEFGPGRLPINVGTAHDIQDLWRNGEEVRGWARYWARLYGFVAQQLESTSHFGGAALVLRYEDLCAEPEKTLTRVFAHAGLNAQSDFITGFAARITPQDYYSSTFSPSERAIIAQETDAVAARLGY